MRSAMKYKVMEERTSFFFDEHSNITLKKVIRILHNLNNSDEKSEFQNYKKIVNEL